MKKHVIFLFLLASVGIAAGATVTAVGYVSGTAGNNNDEVDQWRSTGVNKTYDIDGNNSYGTEGYVAYATDTSPNSNDGQWYNPSDPLAASNGTIQTKKVIPTYITVTSTGMNLWAASYDYPLIDDPAALVAASVGDLECGAAGVYDGGWNVLSAQLTLTISAGFPTSGLRVGVMGDYRNDQMNQARLAQTTGGTSSSTISGTSIDGVLDMYFFDIYGAQAGDVFTLSTSRNGIANPHPTFAAMSFDVIPEAGQILLFGLGVAGLTLRRRRS